MRAGLCDLCRHQKLVHTTRGSTFSMCLRSRTDQRFAKYPRVPVERCVGYEPTAPDAPGVPNAPTSRSS